MTDLEPIPAAKVATAWADRSDVDVLQAYWRTIAAQNGYSTEDFALDSSAGAQITSASGRVQLLVAPHSNPDEDARLVRVIGPDAKLTWLEYWAPTDGDPEYTIVLVKNHVATSFSYSDIAAELFAGADAGVTGVAAQSLSRPHTDCNDSADSTCAALKPLVSAGSVSVCLYRSLPLIARGSRVICQATAEFATPGLAVCAGATALTVAAGVGVCSLLKAQDPDEVSAFDVICQETLSCAGNSMKLPGCSCYDTLSLDCRKGCAELSASGVCHLVGGTAKLKSTSGYGMKVVNWACRKAKLAGKRGPLGEAGDQCTDKLIELCDKGLSSAVKATGACDSVCSELESLLDGGEGDLDGSAGDDGGGAPDASTSSGAGDGATHGGVQDGTAIALGGPPAPPDTVASAVGDPHLLTFDRVRYDAQPVGELTLVQDPTDLFEVQIRTKPWASRTDVAVIVGVAVKMGSNVSAVYLDGRTTRDGLDTTYARGATPLNDGAVVYAGPGGLAFVAPDNTQVRVTRYGSFMGVAVYLADSRRGHAIGLQGSASGGAMPELATRSGAPLSPSPSFEEFYGAYIESWRVTPDTSRFDYAANETTANYTDRSFPHRLASTAGVNAQTLRSDTDACNGARIAPGWLDSCVLDTALTGDSTFASAFVGAREPTSSFSVAPPKPPMLSGVYPQSVVAGHPLTLVGENLTAASGSTDGVSVTLTGTAADGGTVDIALPIVSAVPSQLTVNTPPGLAAQLQGHGILQVTTPYGTTEASSPVSVVPGNVFTQGTGDGGLIAAVYRLKSGTGAFPTTGDEYSLTTPCANATVAPAPQESCPLTTLAASAVNVPVQSFSSGFPGLDPSLTQYFAVRFRGYLLIDTAGSYKITACSDDGSNVYVADAPDTASGGPADGGLSGSTLTKVVANDGLHSMSCVTGNIDITDPGAHRLVVDYLQGPGSQLGIQLYWTPPGGQQVIVPSEHLSPFPPAQ